MTRDYANNKKKYNRTKSSRLVKHSHSDRGKKPNNSLVINFNPMLVLVIIIGTIFIAAVFYLEHMKSFVDKTQKELVAAKSVTQKSVAKTKKEVISRMPKFEFYHTLPKMEVAVNTNGNDKVKDNTTVTVVDKSIDKSAMTESHNYVTSKTIEKEEFNPQGYSLQLASFKDYKDADEFKAKLLLAGFDVYIQTVTLKNGDIWHRVKTNKLTTMADAKDIDNKLRKYNIKSIVVTDRG